MTITRLDRNQTFDQDGNLIAEELVAVDVTEEVNRPIIEQAITQALAELDALIAAPAVPAIPDGTLTVTQLSNAVRQMRDAVQANRNGAQQIAATLKRTIRLVRGDFDDVN